MKKQITVTIPDVNVQCVWRFARRWLLPNLGTLALMIILILTVPALADTTHTSSAPSVTKIPYQGRLANADGSPFTGKQNIVFRLYDVPYGGVPLWIEPWTNENSIDVSDGLFSVMLGSINNDLTSVIQDHEQLYLGIAVGTDSEMIPRVQLGSVPYSMQALTVPDGSVSTSKIADSAVTSGKLAKSAVVEDHLGFMNTFFTETWDNMEFGSDVTNTTWDKAYVKATRHMFLAQKPSGTQLYCRFLAYIHAPNEGDLNLRWGNSDLDLIEVSSGEPDWTAVDSGWVNLSSIFTDGDSYVLEIRAQVSSGTGEISRSKILCAYGP